jgi:WD40 repeat protein
MTLRQDLNICLLRLFAEILKIEKIMFADVDIVGVVCNMVLIFSKLRAKLTKSSTASLIALYDGKKLQIWDLETNSQKRHSMCKGYCLALLKNGKLLSVDNHCYMEWYFRHEDHPRLAKWADSYNKNNFNYGICYFPNKGVTILLSMLFDAGCFSESGKELHQISIPIAQFHQRFTPADDDNIACEFRKHSYFQNDVVIWNINSGIYKVLKGHKKEIYALTSLSGGMLASSAGDNTIRIWNTRTGKCVSVINVDACPITTLCCSNNMLIGAYNRRTEIARWNWKTGDLLDNLTPPMCYRTYRGITAVEVVGNFFVAASSDSTVHIWDISGYYVRNMKLSSNQQLMGLDRPQSKNFGKDY